MPEEPRPAAAARDLPDALVQFLVGVPDERALGLLLDLDSHGPLTVRRLLSLYDTCESDRRGLLAECRVAGLLGETTVGGERAYETTETASEALALLRAVDDE